MLKFEASCDDRKTVLKREVHRVFILKENPFSHLQRIITLFTKHQENTTLILPPHHDSQTVDLSMRGGELNSLVSHAYLVNPRGPVCLHPKLNCCHKPSLSDQIDSYLTRRLGSGYGQVEISSCSVKSLPTYLRDTKAVPPR